VLVDQALVRHLALGFVAFVVLQPPRGDPRDAINNLVLEAGRPSGG